MEDRDLAKYISSYGDGLALIKQHLSKKKKMGLLEKFKAKLQMRKEATANKTKDQVPNTESSGSAKKRPRASHRTIEIGWLHSES